MGKKSDINIFDHLKKVEDLGAGEIILNSIDNDGMMNGYELDILGQISKFSNLPIIVSGGAGDYLHMKKQLIMVLRRCQQQVYFIYRKNTTGSKKLSKKK